MVHFFKNFWKVFKGTQKKKSLPVFKKLEPETTINGEAVAKQYFGSFTSLVPRVGSKHPSEFNFYRFRRPRQNQVVIYKSRSLENVGNYFNSSNAKLQILKKSIGACNICNLKSVFVHKSRSLQNVNNLSKEQEKHTYKNNFAVYSTNTHESDWNSIFNYKRSRRREKIENSRETQKLKTRNSQKAFEDSILKDWSLNNFNNHSQLKYTSTDIDVLMEAKRVKNKKGYDLLKYNLKDSSRSTYTKRCNKKIFPRKLDNVKLARESSIKKIKKTTSDSSPVSEDTTKSKIQSSDVSTEYEIVNLTQIDLFREFKSTISKMKKVLSVLDMKKSLKTLFNNESLDDKEIYDIMKLCLEPEIDTVKSKESRNPLPFIQKNSSKNNASAEMELVFTKHKNVKKDQSCITLDSPAHFLKNRVINSKTITLDSNLFNYIKSRDKMKSKKCTKRIDRKKIKNKIGLPTYPEERLKHSKKGNNRRIIYRISKHHSECLSGDTSQNNNGLKLSSLDKKKLHTDMGRPESIFVRTDKDNLQQQNKKQALSSQRIEPILTNPVIFPKIEHLSYNTQVSNEKNVFNKKSGQDKYKKLKSRSMDAIVSNVINTINQSIKKNTESDESIRNGSQYSGNSTTNWFLVDPPQLASQRDFSTQVKTTTKKAQEFPRLDKLTVSPNRSKVKKALDLNQTSISQDLIIKLIKEEFQTKALESPVSSKAIDSIKKKVYEKLSLLSSVDYPDLIISVKVPLKDIVSKVRSSQSQPLQTILPSPMKESKSNQNVLKESKSQTVSMQTKGWNKRTSGVQVSNLRSKAIETFHVKPEKITKETVTQKSIVLFNKAINPLFPDRLGRGVSESFICKSLETQTDSAKTYCFDIGTNSPAFVFKANDNRGTFTHLNQTTSITGDYTINSTKGFYLNQKPKSTEHVIKREQMSKLFSDSSSTEQWNRTYPKIYFNPCNNSVFGKSTTAGIKKTTFKGIQKKTELYKQIGNETIKNYRRNTILVPDNSNQVNENSKKWCDFGANTAKAKETRTYIVQTYDKKLGRKEKQVSTADKSSMVCPRRKDLQKNKPKEQTTKEMLKEKTEKPNQSSEVYYKQVNNGIQCDTELRLLKETFTNQENLQNVIHKVITEYFNECIKNLSCNKIKEHTNFCTHEKIVMRQEKIGKLETYLNHHTQNSKERQSIDSKCKLSESRTFIPTLFKELKAICGISKKPKEKIEENDESKERQKKVDKQTTSRGTKMDRKINNGIFETNDNEPPSADKKVECRQYYKSKKINTSDTKVNAWPNTSKSLSPMKLNTKDAGLFVTPEIIKSSLETRPNRFSESNLDNLIKEIAEICNASFAKSRNCMMELTLCNLIKEIILEHCNDISDRSKTKLESILSEFVKDVKSNKKQDMVLNVQHLVEEIKACSANKNKSHKEPFNLKNSEEGFKELDDFLISHGFGENIGNKREKVHICTCCKDEDLESLLQRLSKLDRRPNDFKEVECAQLKKPVMDVFTVCENNNMDVKSRNANLNVATQMNKKDVKTKKRESQIFKKSRSEMLNTNSTKIYKKPKKLPVTKIVINVDNLKTLTKKCTKYWTNKTVDPVRFTNTEHQQEIFNSMVAYKIKNTERDIKEISLKSSKHKMKRSKYTVSAGNMNNDNFKRLKSNEETLTFTIQKSSGSSIKEDKNSSNSFSKNVKIKSEKKGKDYLKFKLVRRKTVTSSGEVVQNGSLNKIQKDAIKRITKNYIKKELKLRSDKFCADSIKKMAVKCKRKHKYCRDFENESSLDEAYQRMANFCMFRGLLKRNPV